VRRGKALVIPVAFLAAGVLLAYELPREVIRCPKPAEPLAARLEWARAEAKQRDYTEGFWIAYSIRRLMGENSCIGSFHGGRSSQELTLEEIITGKRSPAPLIPDKESVRRTARTVLEELEKKKREPEKKVWKDVAILLGYGPERQAEMQRVEMSNTDLAFDLEGRPLLWLGEATDDQSLSLLQKLYSSVKPDDSKKHIVAAAGIHGSPGLVVPFLEGILKSGAADDVRKAAAFWLGQQNTQAAYAALRQAAEKDKSGEVREGAVFAISQLEIEASVDGLIELARSARDEEVRKKAIFWLGQKASKKAAPALEGFAFNAADSAVQERAVFALSQLPANEGLDALIKVATTHPNPQVRKKAVFWLGESGDPRALETLIKIVKGK
jgi:HEAT repeat protein